MKNRQESNFRHILGRYMHMSGVRVSLFLKDGSKIRLQNALMKKDYIVNNYYEDSRGIPIPLQNIEFAELFTD